MDYKNSLEALREVSLDIKEGAEMAANAIDEGNSRKALERMVSITNA